jgi:ribosome-binding factor A
MTAEVSAQGAEMAGGFRPKRVAAQIQRELAARLRTVIDEADWGYISITHVDVTRDLQIATVSYMPLGGAAAADGLEEAMKKAAKQLRGPIGRALGLRNSPELLFRPDAHTEEAIRMTALLSQLGASRNDEE